MKAILILSDFREDSELMCNIRRDICNYIGLRFIKNANNIEDDNNPVIYYDCLITEDTKQEIANIIINAKYGNACGLVFLLMSEDEFKQEDYVNATENVK